MRGKGLVMSRLGAGVDMRGPGETKLEVDRRVVRRRIQTLKQRIERMAKTRRTQRARRLGSSVPLIALAGYTNAGKSTLLNALTDAHVSVADRLFETLDPTSRAFRFRDRDYVLTDTVGFIRKLPHQLVDAFASTLEETTLADVVLVVADASLEAAEIAAREETVADVLDMIGSHAPRLEVFNKVDLVDRPGQESAARGAVPGGRVRLGGGGGGAGDAQGAPRRVLRPFATVRPAALSVRGRGRAQPSARHRQRPARGAHARGRDRRGASAGGGGGALRALRRRRGAERHADPF